MSDLVGRLREAEAIMRKMENRPDGDGGLCDEAAARIEELERERDAVAARLERALVSGAESRARADTLAARLKEAEGARDYLRDALRLIELFGYREGEDFGWINAHMRGTATSALEGKDLAFYWRLFPNHLARIKENRG